MDPDLDPTTLPVAAQRHITASLTPNSAVSRLADEPTAYKRVRDVIEAKMQVAREDSASIGRCLARLDELEQAWVRIADKQTRNGDEFAYASQQPVRRLLQDPFDQQPNMDKEREWFVAGRSMRDTEPVSLLKLRKPDGTPL